MSKVDLVGKCIDIYIKNKPNASEEELGNKFDYYYEFQESLLEKVLNYYEKIIKDGVIRSKE